MLINLPLDIETIPAQRPDIFEELRAAEQSALDAAIAEVRAPGNYGAEAAAKWMAEKGEPQIARLRAEFDARVDECYRKTALDGAFGQVAVISFARESATPITLWNQDWAAPNAEASLLEEFTARLMDAISPSELHSTTVVGHNVSSFDLRFLIQRCIVRGVRPHPVIRRAAMAKPWETDKVFDTMVQWAGVGGRVSLDKLCKALSLPGKGDMDGSKVWDYVNAGRISEVADYCADDVRKVRAIHERMTFETLPQEQFEDVPA